MFGKGPEQCSGPFSFPGGPAAARPLKGKAGIALVFGAVVGLVFIGSQPASATPARITAAETCCTFIDGPFEQPRGEVAAFVNPAGATAFHNVYATAAGPDGGELFRSATIEPGKETPVAGTQYLDTGTYPFVCTVHPGMEGSLSVDAGGAPQARPAVRVSIPRQGIRVVQRKGVLKVAVASRTGASGVSVTITVAGTKAGRAGSISIGSGRSATVAVRLSARGRQVLKGRKSVRVEATAKVSFGSPSSTGKVIR